MKFHKIMFPSQFPRSTIGNIFMIFKGYDPPRFLLLFLHFSAPRGGCRDHFSPLPSVCIRGQRKENPEPSVWGKTKKNINKTKTKKKTKEKINKK